MNTTEENKKRQKFEFSKNAIFQLFKFYESNDEYRDIILKDNKGFIDECNKGGYTVNENKELIMAVFMALFAYHNDNRNGIEKSDEDLLRIAEKCWLNGKNIKRTNEDVGKPKFNLDHPRVRPIVKKIKASNDMTSEEKQQLKIDKTKLMLEQIRNGIAHGKIIINNDGTVTIWNDWKNKNDNNSIDFRCCFEFDCIVDVCLELLGKEKAGIYEKFLKDIFENTQVADEELSGRYKQFAIDINEKIKENSTNEQIIDDVSKKKMILFDLMVHTLIAHNEGNAHDNLNAIANMLGTNVFGHGKLADIRNAVIHHTRRLDKNDHLHIIKLDKSNNVIKDKSVHFNYVLSKMKNVCKTILAFEKGSGELFPDVSAISKKSNQDDDFENR